MPRIERATTTGRAGWLTIAGILLVPLAVGGLLLAGLWKPADRLEQVTAAIVNDDEPVELDGQTVPLGRQLAAGLVTGGSDAEDGATASVSSSNVQQNFTWVLTDADDAAEGLADGSYATVVTIPEDFSAAATSYAGDADDATRATVDIATSDRSRLVDDAVSELVTSTAISVLNGTLTQSYLENVYVGFDTLGSSLGDAADGATKLADGVTQLGTGATALSDGVRQLGTGASGLAGGIRQVGTGADGLASGLTQLSTQTGTVAGGLTRLSTGATALGQGAQASAGYAGQSATLAQGMAADVGALLADCQTTPAPHCATVLSLAQQLGITTATPADGTLLYATGAAAAASSGVSAGLTQSQNGQPSFVDGLAASAGGVTAIAGGIGQTAAGAAKLADGTDRLASGADQLASGAAAAASGGTDLADGATQVSSGATELADGLGQATDGLPAYTDDQGSALASVVAEPVERTGDDAAELFGAASIPFFATIALWLGGLAMYLLLAAVPQRALGSTRSPLRQALRTGLPGLALGAAQGVALGVALSIVIDLEPMAGLGFAGLSALAGLAFAAVNQALVAAFGGIGRFVSMLVAVLGLATAVVSTVPAWFDAIVGVLPIASALGGMQAIVEGGAWGGSAVALVLWTLGALGVTTLAIARRRTVPADRLVRRAALA